jgi:hypothetical protein
MLTARITGDKAAFDQVTAGMPEGYAVALLMRTAEMMVNMMAGLTGQTRDETLKSTAAALAAEMSSLNWSSSGST